MYLGIDVGGTKTLMAVFTNDGALKQSIKFKTPQDYKEFVLQIASKSQELDQKSFNAVCVAIPGRIDRDKGTVISAGNLGWKNLPVKKDIAQIFQTKIIIENDANLGGLSEASNVSGDIDNVLYITISTGIGTGIITNGIIDPSLADTEGGQTIFRHNGKLQRWEKFASGKAIVKKYGKKASEITDEKTWKTIARDLSLGFLDLAMIIQPDVIIVGGGVGSHFEKFKKPLLAELKKFETPLAPIPPIKKAKRPEEAVIYGCYELAKDNDNG